MLKCVAVDDEKLVLDLLVDNIEKVRFLQLAGLCRNVMEAAEILHREKIDLIFLDIQMPGLNGLQFVKTLQQAPMVIFNRIPGTCGRRFYAKRGGLPA